MFYTDQVTILVDQKKGRQSGNTVLKMITERVELDVLGRQLDSSVKLTCVRFCLQNPQFRGSIPLLLGNAL